MLNDFREMIKNKDFQLFFFFIFGLLILPILTYFITNKFLPDSSAPVFFTLGVIVFLKFGFVIFLLLNHNKIEGEKLIEKKNK